MVVARDALLRHALVFHRRFEHHAVGKLLDHPALDLLPGGLAAKSLEAALLGEPLLAAVVLRVADQDIGCTPVQIDANPVIVSSSAVVACFKEIL